MLHMHMKNKTVWTVQYGTVLFCNTIAKKTKRVLTVLITSDILMYANMLTSI